MGIVIITMPGEGRRIFANTLHEKTGGAVDLVIIQRSPLDSWQARLRRLYNARKGFFSDLWYGLLLRLLPGTRKTLEYFRSSGLSPSSVAGYLPPVIFVDSINSAQVHSRLKKISPDLLVTWGSKILEPHIIGTAERAINLHMGRCPYYRGTLANQCAVLSDDLSHIGATVHYLSDKVDRGDILHVIEPDMALSPRELFIDLNARAQLACIDIAARLFKGEALPASPQAATQGKNLLMKQWRPQIRYGVARRMKAWEERSLSAADAAKCEKSEEKIIPLGIR